LRSALQWTGQTPPGGSGFGRFALKARANVVGGSIALTNVNVELDGNVAEGVMTYSNNGRQTLQATLAADALDFTPYISTFRGLASGARDWNRQLFDLKALSATDLDMRLSAARVTVGPSKLGRTAFGANLRGGALALSVGEAQVYGGIARGSFGIARSDTVADVKAQFQFLDVDLQACANELFGINRLSGRGNLNVSLVATGSSPFGLVQSLDGTARLTGHDGAISGFNVEQLLRRLERRPLSGAGSFRSGSTPYDNLTVALKFADGIATTEEVKLESATSRVTLTGTIAVPNREYDLKGVASLVSAQKGDSNFDLPFVVSGPWDDPLIFPEAESLIRRSTTVAPLLDALKGGRAGDTVRSVIERLTGGAARPAPAPDAAAPAPQPAAK
jgi:AsmA protein